MTSIKQYRTSTALKCVNENLICGVRIHAVSINHFARKSSQLFFFFLLRLYHNSSWKKIKTKLKTEGFVKQLRKLTNHFNDVWKRQVIWSTFGLLRCYYSNLVIVKIVLYKIIFFKNIFICNFKIQFISFYLICSIVITISNHLFYTDYYLIVIITPYLQHEPHKRSRGRLIANPYLRITFNLQFLFEFLMKKKKKSTVRGGLPIFRGAMIRKDQSNYPCEESIAEKRQNANSLYKRKEKKQYDLRTIWRCVSTADEQSLPPVRIFSYSVILLNIIYMYIKPANSPGPK